MRSCGAGVLARAVEPARHRLVERVDEQRRLAAARDAGDAGEQAERDLGGDVLQIVAARADRRLSMRRGSRLAALGGIAIARSPVRYWPVSEAGLAMISAGVPCATIAAAVHAGARADVDHVVGGADRVLVVLDHDHRVAEVAQALERLEQPRVVALVQADRRLVEHVEHAGQARADLRGEPDALALAARQRAGGARQGQIVEPDVDQEAQPLADLLEDAAGDLVLLGGRAAPAARRTMRRRADRQLGHLADVQPADLDRQRLGLEPVAVAGLARAVGRVALEISSRAQSLSVSRQRRSRLAITPSNGLLRLVGAQPVVVGEADRLVARAVQDRVLRLLRAGPSTGVEA